MNDLITERADKCLCPICNEDIGTEFKLVEYKGKRIWIHKRHYVEGE